MPVKRPPLVNNEIYHIVTRGVEKRIIFQDESDYYRGIFSIYEFNNEKPVLIRDRRRARVREKNGRDQTPAIRKTMVDILAFCLMPNHIHLLVRQLKDNGISKFMKKLGAGYAVYFNKKYNRVGHLFQGRFRAVLVRTTEQLQNTFVYIHVNPTELVETGWKEKGIKEPEKTIKFLENYKWSSYSDYIGRKNFPSLTNRDFIYQTIGEQNEIKHFIEDWIQYKGEVKTLGEIAIE